MHTTIDFFSVADAAQLLNLKYWQLDYAARAGYIPPPLRIAGKKVYAKSQLPALREHFDRGGRPKREGP